MSASWTSLVTPIQIVVPTPLVGTEIDLLSQDFDNQFAQLWNSTSGIQAYRKICDQFSDINYSQFVSQLRQE